MINKKDIREISKKINMQEEELEKILDNISKPSLTNTHCTFDDESGIGPSDRSN